MQPTASAKLLFVMTSATNMGDLALCKEWIEDLGREAYRFAYTLPPALQPFIDEEDRRYLYDPEVDIKETVMHAVRQFHPDAIVFATNAFWNLPGYKGVRFGEFLLSPGDVDVPVLSFDPFETGFVHRLPQNGGEVPFSPVPGWVYALRYMSREPKTPNALHFRTHKTYRSRKLKDPDIIGKYGGSRDKRTIVFPVSRDRHLFIQEHYPDYYTHLAGLFRTLPEEEVRIMVVLPEAVPAFAAMDNIIQLPFIRFDDFLDLVQAADLYLTDSFVSCMVTSIQLETPALLLTNHRDTPARGSFMNEKPFRYSVFPYGMYEVCRQLEECFEISRCYTHCEVLDAEAFTNKVNRILYHPEERDKLQAACRAWKQDRQHLPGPAEVLERVWASSLKTAVYGT